MGIFGCGNVITVRITRNFNRERKSLVLSTGVIVVYLQECTQGIKTPNVEETVQPRKID